MPTQLSEHFTLEEMILSQVASRHQIDNAAGPEQTQNLMHLCRHMLEPIRALIDAPLCITSGYRCEKVNTLIGGSANSQHMKGEAADIFCPRMSQQELFNILRQSNLPFDQLIDEFDAWVHVSYTQSGQIRRDVLRARKVDGVTRYAEL